MFALAHLQLPTRPHCRLHPPTPIESIRDITAVQKTNSKTRGIQIAGRISYEALAILLGYSHCKFGGAALHH